MTFALGQRWVSDTEGDLGLGTVVEVDGRTVTVYFSACEETRVYAQQNAPLTRVIFNVGDTIENFDGGSLTVESLRLEADTVVYIGRSSVNGKIIDDQQIELKEIMLSHHIRFNQPQDKLFAGQLDRLDNFVLRYQALHHQYQQLKSPLRGLCGMRAGLIPHQLYIAHEVGRRHAPRVLLADEVGLGKTIEAGMIIHQQLLLGRSSRVLIVVPDSLQHQWLVEMLRRFNLHFSIFDQERCLEVEAEGNPFESQQYVLCSLDFLCQHPERYQQALEAPWDLLVVDEAHHLSWQQDAPSLQYQVIEGLANKIAGVLLLTATPEQLGHESHFARLRLLDADRFYDYAQFMQEEKRYAAVAELVSALQQNSPWNSSFDALIEPLSFDQKTQQLIEAWQQGLWEKAKQQVDEDLADEDKEELITTLIDRYGTGRILFRNTRAAIQGFPERRAHLVELEKPAQYQAYALTPELGWIDASPWWMHDSRVDWLLEKIKQKRSEKLLVIASQACTALELEQALREREGVRATVFHEGMSIVERDKAAAYFAEQEGGAQVLICSEIGSEGRNFQFAHQLVMFDLPHHPDLLEQRIGRLDRIGQTQAIDIYALYFTQTASSTLAHWYHQGLNAFESTCPAGRAVYDQYQSQLLDLLDEPNQEALDRLIEQTAETHQSLTEALEQGRDRLLEKQSNGGEQAHKIAEQIAQGDKDEQLIDFSSALFDTIGLNQEEKGEDTWVVTPSDQMMVPSYPGLPYDGATITFDRDLALAMEDLHFMSWEHPMIQGGIDVLLSEGVGTNNVSVLPHPKLPVGTLFLELIYVVDAQAPKSSGIHQFLPNTPIRVLLDQKGNNLSNSVPFDAFNSQLRSIDKKTGRKVVQSVQAVIQSLIDKAEQEVTPSIEKVKQQAHQVMKDTLQGERDRLAALQQVNPNIRSQEIELIDRQINDLSTYINDAQCSLDALRVIVVSQKS